MDAKKIIITGANGYIGSFLTGYLKARGHQVIPFVRKPKAAGEIFYELTSDIDEASLMQSDAVIHCAFIPKENNPTAFEDNVTGTEKLMALCRKHNVKFLFLSTLSAHPDAESEYGRHKSLLENKMDPNRDAVIKPGLVLGNGGLFGRILGFCKKFRIIPLIDGGKQPFQFIAIEDLALAAAKIIESNRTGKYVLVSPERLDYLKFYQSIAKVFGIRLWYLKIPVAPILFFLGAFEKIRIKLPVNKENLLGLKNMKYINPENGLQTLEIVPETLETVLERLSKTQ